MTPILREQIVGPMAWAGKDFKSKDELAFDLSARNLAALKDVLGRVEKTPRDEITLRMASHPGLDEDLATVYRELIQGRGLVVLRGMPVHEHSVEDMEKMLWCVLVHWGEMLSNNSFGHRMVRVQQELLPGGVQPARGTKSAQELAMHNDAGDLFSLLCVNKAQKGGESQFASAAAAHNTILRDYPEALPILYRGFPRHRRSEQYDDQPAVTPYSVPIFASSKGRVSLNFTYSSVIPALYELGRELTEAESKALDALRETLVRQQVEFQLEPGEAAIANNFATCHSRSDYIDSPNPEKKRLILRAWMEVPAEDRLLPVGREFFQMENKSGRLGYDLVPGREGKIARNDYVGVDEKLAALFKATQAKPRVQGQPKN